VTSCRCPTGTIPSSPPVNTSSALVCLCAQPRRNKQHGSRSGVWGSEVCGRNAQEAHLKLAIIWTAPNERIQLFPCRCRRCAHRDSNMAHDDHRHQSLPPLRLSPPISRHEGASYSSHRACTALRWPCSPEPSLRRLFCGAICDRLVQGVGGSARHWDTKLVSPL
jgi:hypothetical protein